MSICLVCVCVHARARVCLRYGCVDRSERQVGLKVIHPNLLCVIPFTARAGKIGRDTPGPVVTRTCEIANGAGEMNTR